MSTIPNHAQMHLPGLSDPPLSNPFEDDTPLECGLENPETCESCE